MLLRLLLAGPHGDAVTLVRAAPGTPLSAVAAPLGRLAGASVLAVDGRPLAAGDPLGLPPLVDGARVTAWAGGARSDGPDGSHAPDGPAGVDLVVTGGPDAGRRGRLGGAGVSVGSSARADITVADPALGPVHLRLEPGHGGVRVRAALAAGPGARAGATPAPDLGGLLTANVAATPPPAGGVSVDGRAVGPGGATLRAGGVVRAGASRFELRPAAPGPVRGTPLGDGGVAINRRPRGAPPRPLPTRRLRPAPTPPDPGHLDLLTLVLPLVACVALAAMAGSPMFLAFGLLSPVLAVTQLYGRRRRDRRRHAGELADHAAHRARLAARLERDVARELARRRRETPDLARVLDVARGRLDPLWDRRRGEPDLLRVRVGTGRVRARFTVASEGAPARSPWLDDAPVALDLDRGGPVGVHGPRPQALGLARGTVGQLAVRTSPREVRIWVFAASATRLADWEWAALLPHTLAQEAGGAAGEAPGGRPVRLAGGARAVARQAAALLAEAAGGPVHVVVLDGAHELRTAPGMGAVLAASTTRAATGMGAMGTGATGTGATPGASVHVVCLDDDATRLPVECESLLAARAAGLGVSGPALGDVVAGSVTPDAAGPVWGRDLARALAPLRDVTPGLRGPGSLPDAVDLLDLLGRGHPADLAAQWAARPRSTRAVIGVAADGPHTLDLRTDGPHVLVGGMTGSGKSELLRTLLVSLAYANRPDELSFVLMDYKGGSAFAECVDLPHTAALVTDLEPETTARALASLRAELRRRERLLRDAGVSDIEAYHRLRDEGADARAAGGDSTTQGGDAWARSVDAGAGHDADPAPAVADSHEWWTPAGKAGTHAGGPGSGEGASPAAGSVGSRGAADVAAGSVGSRAAGDVAAGGAPAGGAAPWPALPRLVVVVDEFRALAEEQAEVVSGLVRVATQGRSLGLHLVLATQRPAGVVSAEIKANTNLRIALRVRDRGDSLDVIETDDAAAITAARPGRALLRAGGGDLVAVQVARVGAPARVERPEVRLLGLDDLGARLDLADTAHTLDAVGPLGGARVRSAGPAGADRRSTGLPEGAWSADPGDHAANPTSGGVSADVARPSDGAPGHVEFLREAAALRRVDAVAPPWLPPLPHRIADLADVPGLATGPGPDRLAFAVVDLPDAQAVEPAAVDLGRGDHVAVVGGAGSGRTTLLRALAHAAEGRCPGRTEIHVVDGGHGLRDLAESPACATYVALDEPGRLRRLLHRLLGRAREAARATPERAAAGAPAPWSGGPVHDGPPACPGCGRADAPAVVLLLDGWDVVREALDRLDPTAVDDLVALLRVGDAGGVRVVVTGGRGLLFGTVGGLFGDRYLLRVTDPADVLLAGLPASAAPPAIPGRGRRLRDGALLQVLDTPPGRPAGRVPACPPRPWRHAPLPTDVRLADLPVAAPAAADPAGRTLSPPTAAPADLPTPAGPGAGEATGPAAAPSPTAPAALPLALAADTLDPVALPLGTDWLVAGPPGSGRTTVLRTLAAAADAAGLPVLVVAANTGAPAPPGDAGWPAAAILVDPAAGRPVDVPRGPHVLLVDDLDRLAGTAVEDALVALVAARRRDRLVVAAGASRRLAEGFRGLAPELRRAGRGLVLCPTPADRDLFGSPPPAGEAAEPGRGAVLADGRWTVVQVARP